MDTDDTDAPMCYVRTGERLYFAKGGGFIHEDGHYVPPGTMCTIEPGGGFSAPIVDVEPVRHRRRGGAMSKPEVPQDGETPANVPSDEEAASVPADVQASPPVHHSSGQHHNPPPVELQSVAGDDEGGLGQVLGLGSMLEDNPWAPLVIIVLALVAVLGGRQGWKYYSDRAAQHHELELKKLELQAQVQGLNGAQPPPCQARDIEHEQKMAKINERLEEDEKRIGALERRLASFSGPEGDQLEEFEKRLKKAERSIAALKRDDA